MIRVSCDVKPMSDQHSPTARTTDVAGCDDPVNHPRHYNSHPSGVSPIVLAEHMTFCLGNVLKYCLRSPYKGNQIEDLKKARWYLDREIARLEQDFTEHRRA